MSSDEKTRKALVNIKNYASAGKDIVDVGIHIIGKLHPAGAVILALAYTIKNIIGVYGPDENQEVMDALKELRKKVDGILDSMNGHFTAFKAFYSENQFWNDIPLRTSVLYQYMLDLQSSPTKKNLRRFQVQYEKHDPVELAQRLNYQLKRDVMNPLENVANTDELLTNETFRKWFNLIGHVFKQLWEIEIKAGVWVHDLKVENIEEMDRVVDMMDQIDEFRKQMEIWDEKYEEKSPYWPEKVRKLAEKALDDNKQKSDKEKAEAIARQLETIHTRCEFYVLVFSDSLKHTYHEIRKNQTLEMKRDGLTVIIYRSKEAYKETDAVLNRAFTNLQLYKNIRNLAEPGRHFESNVKHIALIPVTKFKDSGVLLSVSTRRKGSGVEVAWSKSILHKDGCGQHLDFSIGLGDWKFNQFAFTGYK